MHKPRALGRPSPKLRDSCQACASSKVKCQKEKPKCSRCAKRGLECEYLATKRAGRTSYKKQAAKQQLSGDEGKKAALGGEGMSAAGLPVTTSDSWFTLNAFAAAKEAHPAASSQQQPFGSLGTPSDGAPSSYHHLFPEVVATMDQAMPPSSSSLGQRSRFDDFLDLAASPTVSSSSPTSTEPPLPDAHLFSLPSLESMDVCSESSRSSFDPLHHHHHHHHHAFADMDDAYTGLSGDFFSVLDPSLTSPRLSRASSHTTAISSPQQPCRSLDTPAGAGAGVATPFDTCYKSCLHRALDLLKKLAPTPASPCPLSGGGRSPRRRDADDAAADPRTLPSIPAVIAQNRQAMDAVRSMLECPCAKDNFLAVVLVLVLCKVFGWYAAAARVQIPRKSNASSGGGSVGGGSPPPPSPSSLVEHIIHEQVAVGSYCLDGEDSTYMAGQLVLSELHRVQRIVNQLSKRLTAQMNAPCSKAGETFSMSLFSATLLYQLERDMRKGLKKLSLDIIRELEREFR